MRGIAAMIRQKIHSKTEKAAGRDGQSGIAVKAGRRTPVSKIPKEANLRHLVKCCYSPGGSGQLTKHHHIVLPAGGLLTDLDKRVKISVTCFADFSAALQCAV